MKKLYFYLIMVAFLLCSCKKEDICSSPNRNYCYREIATHNVMGCTYISPCDETRKQQFHNLCPSGYEVIWNP